MFIWFIYYIHYYYYHKGLLMSKNDLESLISWCHSYHIPVIIDEAHGAHLRFISTTTTNEQYAGI